jgi:hypothetical protein
VVIATTRGSCVAENSQRHSILAQGQGGSVEQQRGRAAHDQEQDKEEPELQHAR